MTSTECEFVAAGVRCEQPATRFEDRQLCNPHRAYVEEQRHRLRALHAAGRRRTLKPADLHAALVDLERDLKRVQRDRQVP